VKRFTEIPPLSKQILRQTNNGRMDSRRT